MEPIHASGRQIRATVLLAEVAAADRQGLLAGVRRHASPALLKNLDRPPLAMTLIPGELMDDLHGAVALAGGGREAIIRVLLDCLRVQIGPMMRPIIESTRTLYGSTPEAFLSNLGTIAAPMVSGFVFEWASDGPRSGTMTVRPESKPNGTTFAVWEAVIAYFIETAGEKGVVDKAVLQEEGWFATIHASW